MGNFWIVPLLHSVREMWNLYRVSTCGFVFGLCWNTVSLHHHKQSRIVQVQSRSFVMAPWPTSSANYSFKQFFDLGVFPVFLSIILINLTLFINNMFVICVTYLWIYWLVFTVQECICTEIQFLTSEGCCVLTSGHPGITGSAVDFICNWAYQMSIVKLYHGFRSLLCSFNSNGKGELKFQ